MQKTKTLAVTVALVLMVGAQSAHATGHQFIALKSASNGMFVSPESGGGTNTVYLDAGEADIWQTLLLVDNDDGTCHLKTIEGAYIGVWNGGGTSARAKMDAPGSDETFVRFDLGGRPVGLSDHLRPFLEPARHAGCGHAQGQGHDQ